MTPTSLSPSPHSALRRCAAILGWLCLFATLALLSPGVLATASAEDLPDAGPTCQPAEQNAESAIQDMAQTIEQLRAQAEAKGTQQGDYVVLNNRGYNYGPAPAPDGQPTDR